MYITEKVPISQADYEELKDSADKTDEYVGWRARFSSYPPAGYGFMSPRVFIENKNYYCSWEHRDNCD